MAAVLAAASYSRIGFSLYFAVCARRVRVPGGSKFHLEPGTIISLEVQTSFRLFWADRVYSYHGKSQILCNINHIFFYYPQTPPRLLKMT